MPPRGGSEHAGVLRGLARVHELAALVEVVAHGHGQVLLALGHGQVLDLAEQVGVGEEVLLVLREAVVALLPHDGAEVAEDAERVGHALGVVSQVAWLTPLASSAAAWSSAYLGAVVPAG